VEAKANMVVIGSQAANVPLSCRLVDELHDESPNVKAFGPVMARVQLEASKGRCRE
jgi:phosphoribosylamine-glycine ligase